MSATESLASVDMICVDKTGTLTAGELRLSRCRVRRRGRPQSGAAALGRFAASAGNRNQTLETIAARYPGKPGGARRGALLLGVEVERRLARRRGAARPTCSGRPTSSPRPAR